MWFKILKYIRRSREEQILLVEAYIALSRARLMLATRSFQSIADRLGQVGQESPFHITRQQDLQAERISRVIETMSRHTPWQSRCLTQAIAGWLMLRHRGIAGTIYFGVAQNPDKPFDAHAWLRCGSRCVTGGDGNEQFQVLTSIACSPSVTHHLPAGQP